MTEKDKNILLDQLKQLDYSIVLLLAATLIEAHNAHDWKELIWELKEAGKDQSATGSGQ